MNDTELQTALTRLSNWIEDQERRLVECPVKLATGKIMAGDHGIMFGRHDGKWQIICEAFTDGHAIEIPLTACSVDIKLACAPKVIALLDLIDGKKIEFAEKVSKFFESIEGK